MAGWLHSLCIACNTCLDAFTNEYRGIVQSNGPWVHLISEILQSCWKVKEREFHILSLILIRKAIQEMNTPWGKLMESGELLLHRKVKN